jgi:hypothetical protein
MDISTIDDETSTLVRNFRHQWGGAAFQKNGELEFSVAEE